MRGDPTFHDDTCRWRGGPQVSAAGWTCRALTDTSSRPVGAGSGVRTGVCTEGQLRFRRRPKPWVWNESDTAGAAGHGTEPGRCPAVCLSHDHGLGDTLGAQGTDAGPGWGMQAHASPVPAASGSRRGCRGPGLWSVVSWGPVSPVLRYSHETGSPRVRTGAHVEEKDMSVLT